MTTAELLAQDTDSTDLWVIEGFLPIGLAILSAQPKSGKSRACMQEADAIASGRSFLEFNPPRPQHALYYSLEQGDRSVQEAVRSLGLAADSDIDWQFKLPGDGTFNAFLEDVRAKKRARPDLRFVAVDMWNRLPLPKDALSEGGVYLREQKALAPLQGLAQELEIAIQLLHHTNAAGERHGGSNAVAGTADTLWMIERPAGATQGTWNVSGRDVPDLHLQPTWDPSNGSWNLAQGSIPKTLQVKWVPTKTEKVEAAVEHIVGVDWIDRPTLLTEVSARFVQLGWEQPATNYLPKAVDGACKKLVEKKVFEKSQTNPVRYRLLARR